MRILVAVALLGCGGTHGAEEREPLVFEPFSPPQFTSREVFVAAHGDVVVLSNRISRDAGATWEPSPIGALDRVAISGTTIATYTSGLVRYDVATRASMPVTGAPSYTSARTWRTDPAQRFIVFDPVRNAIAFEGAGGFSTTTLPQPTPTEFDPYVTDVASNGTIAMAVSGWGVFRYASGAWERVLSPDASLGRELVALVDGRFILLGGSLTHRFDAAGAPAGTAPGLVVETEAAAACHDGAVVANGKLSRDAGATWQPFLSTGTDALVLTIERIGCGANRYWIVGHSSAWGYRVLRYDAQAADGIAIGNWEAGAQAWSAAGPPIVRTASGTFIANGLAWTPGDATWSLRLAPATTWAAGEALFGIANDQFFTSADAGRIWQSTKIDGLGDTNVEAFARSPDGALHVARFAGNSTAARDEWHATVWRSADSGATWTPAYDARASRDAGQNTIGEVHRFIGITGAGTWIATDAISNDAGLTWQPTEFEGDRSLAFVTPDGNLVTPRDDIWRVYEAGGLGDLRGTWELEAEGQPIPASQLRSVAFDELGHAYVARGAPYVQIWRTTKPIVR
jgi:hypothetical protein